MQQARKYSEHNLNLSPARPVKYPRPGQRTDSRLKKVKLVSIFITCFILGIVVVAQYSSLVIINYRLGNMRAELAGVTEASRILELEVAQLSTIGRIEQIAKVDLGMVEPHIGQLRILTAHQGEGSRLGE